MAEHQRFADLNHGHAGLLTYIPSDSPQDGPGSLHTSRLTTSLLHFSIVGSSAQLYPPSKSSAPIASPLLWRERQLQQRWLLNSHPEAFMGNPSLQGFLKGDMGHFRRTEETVHRKQLLAIGQMADLRDHSDIKSMPLLAVATGESGELLRLARVDESRWQWGEIKDVVLNLSVIDSVHQEEETIWASDCLPISQIKFAIYFSQHNSVRWLLVQKSTSTTILQPEYHPIPVLESGTTTEPTHQRSSYINPNPLLTLHNHRTGGNAHSDMSFNPAVLGRPPQLAVMDECGYWSVWNILGTWQVDKKTLRLSQYKCGHILEGILDAIPTSPGFPAERHGLLRVGRSEVDETYRVPSQRAANLGTMTSPSQYVLMWSSERFEVADLESDTLLPKLELLLPATARPDRILDVQRSPLDDDHVFVLTTRRVIWVDLHCRERLSEVPSRPAILLSCSHFGIGHQDIRMSVAQASDHDTDNALVFTYSTKTEQLCVYWFTLSSADKLPQWSRHVTQLPGSGEAPSRTNIQFLRVLPAALEKSPECSHIGPGSHYLQRGSMFYQVTTLGEDLSVRYCICTTSRDPTLEVVLPTTRIGWSQNEQRRRWKKKRRYFLRHIGDTFVIPDSMSDAKMESLLRHNDADDDEEPQQVPEAHSSSEPRPILLKMNRISQVIREQLDLAATQGELGLPVAMFESMQSLIEAGLRNGTLPLTTWAEVVDELEHPVAYEFPDNGMEEDVERLFDRSDEKFVATQLRRHCPDGLPSSLLGLPYLQRRFSELWLNSMADKFPEEVQQIRKVWVSEIAKDVFLSSYGVMVQDVLLLGPSSSKTGEHGQGDESMVLPSQPSLRSTQIASSSPTRPTSTALSSSPSSDAAFQRLKLLAPSLEPGKLGATKQSKIISYWPTERGVDTRDYVSSVAVATDEKFNDARQRLRKIEAKRKAQAERYRRPAFMRQGFPMSDVPSQEGISLPMRPPPMQAMSSQQAAPDSSQTQGPFGPSVTMSQPVPGMFGDRKKTKKGKRKSGFR
ncbi:hypothetical protein TOPH_00866 [Tolypocladium ophioglossoides CBS 100239]|uniref:RNA polymerase I-specific transcription initiation factor RRN6 n=1 Tax=Tolypocladium ophioglossoides (strain CBS 100239) TaxID=1163406 RepID=A0A0L0NJF8_TOLOC|nr:hypothetical protein TOPH_00866 [Tolypocladium ophioglossoides CBS 100239]